MRLLHIFLLVFSATSCMAQPTKTIFLADELDCTDITTSPQLDDCVHKEMMNSNALLLTEFVNFEKRAKRVYAADLKLGKELIAVVSEAQDAWITFRDRTCKIEAFEIEKETPAYVTTVNSCVIRLNTARIEELKNLLR
ncbi:MAG: DUF1311 domain-containing protein [Gammaproteobacteria bacterium]|nr:DUF1311 domain-containing protein [Gammaproteobacteria bacterium]MCF6261361.1 DUF1311 domain-containing protein [Gammaproteobacteria bacterium]